MLLHTTNLLAGKKGNGVSTEEFVGEIWFEEVAEGLG